MSVSGNADWSSDWVSVLLQQSLCGEDTLHPTLPHRKMPGRRFWTLWNAIWDTDSVVRRTLEIEETSSHNKCDCEILSLFERILCATEERWVSKHRNSFLFITLRLLHRGEMLRTVQQHKFKHKLPQASFMPRDETHHDMIVYISSSLINMFFWWHHLLYILF